MKTVFIASDHAGYSLKEILAARLRKITELEDLGTSSSESTDYPMYAERVARKVLENPDSLGVLLCGSGIGVSIAANKVKGIRAACVSDVKSAALAREHNDAQILCLGARIIDAHTAWACVNSFLDSHFDRSNPRHQRRIDQITELETKC